MKYISCECSCINTIKSDFQKWITEIKQEIPINAKKVKSERELN